MDIIYNGQAQGGVASQLLASGFNVNGLRPYIDIVDGRPVHCITVVENGKPTQKVLSNATATLRKDQWKHLDTAVVKVAKERLRTVQDLLGAGLTYNIPNGMGTTVLETETQSDITEADISMDGVRQSRADRPVYELKNLPLPIIHKDFHFSARQIATAQRSGSPLDTTTAELASRRVAESAEKLLLGTFGTYSFGGGNIYGYTNFPQRITKSITAPTAQGWTPATAVKEVLDMRLRAQLKHHYGPYMLYCSLPWDTYLDDDYSAAKGDNTLRDRLNAIEGIQGVRTVDFLSQTAFQLILVQMTSDVVREVIGLNFTTVQWESQGGLQINFKVMAIMTPQLRADQNGNTGIVHGSV